MQKQRAAKPAKTGSGGLSRREIRRRAFLARWSKVDWSKLNSELAVEAGLSRERLRQIRLQIGAPKCPRPYRTRKSAAALQWAKENLDKLKGLSAPEVGRKYGFSAHWHKGPLYPFLKPYLRSGRLLRRHRWDLMNFELPNRDLERIWRLPSNMVDSYRRRKGHPRSKWYFRHGPSYTKLSGQGQLQAYRQAVKAEERAAAKWFAHAEGSGLKREG